MSMLALGAAGLALGGVSQLGNLGMGYLNLKYQKGLQQDIFNREDNSIQRRVADLRTAGLSPVLAAGQGANAGAIIQTKAPEIQGNPLQDAMQLMQMKENIANTEAQRELIQLQQYKTLSDISVNETNMNYTEANTRLSEATRSSVKVKTANDLNDLRLRLLAGTGSNPSFVGNIVKDFTGMIDKAAQGFGGTGDKPKKYSTPLPKPTSKDVKVDIPDWAKRRNN